MPELPLDRQGREVKAQDAATATRRLVERAQRGDSDAFAELFRLHQRRVFSLIGHLVRRPAEVEDIAQEVFLKVYRSLGRFNFRAAFSTWLYRIVVNECHDYLRRQRAQKSGAGKEIAVAEPAEWERLAAPVAVTQAQDVARRAELRQLAEWLFAHLPEQDRVLLTLRELEGLSVDEIAEVVGSKGNTVKVRLFRARRRLLELHRRSLNASRRK